MREGLSKKEMAQRRSAAAGGGRALVERYGRAHMAAIGRKGGQATFNEIVRNANARANEARRRSKRRPSRAHSS